MPRTAETLFVGDAASIVRAAQEAAAATEGAEKKIVSSNGRVAKSHDAVSKSASKTSRDIVLAGAAVVAASVDMAVKSESAAAAVAKSAGISAASAEKIVKSFRGLPETEYSATKIATAFATVASELGVVEHHALGTASATKVMKAALDLTDATGGNLTQTTEALGKVMLTYGIHAEGAAKASDVLFNASKRTGTSVEEVSQIVDKMHGRLGILAPSLAETAGLMDDFARHGLKGREALTALTGVYTTLLGENKKTKAAVKELGLQLTDQQGRFVGLKNVIGQLQPAMSKLHQNQQIEYASALFGAKAAKQLLTIIREAPAAYQAETTAAAKNATTAAAAAKEHQTLEGKLKQARAAAENLGASIGEKVIPALTAMLKAVEDGVNWLGKHKTAAEALAAVVSGVLGAALAVYAYSKAAAFVKATSEMIGGLKALAVRMGVTAGAVETGDAAMATANAATGASFTSLAKTAAAALAKIVTAIVAAEAAAHLFGKVLSEITGEHQPENLSELFGGSQPGEKGIAEADRNVPRNFAKQHGGLHASQGQLGSSNQFAFVSEVAKRYGVSPNTLWGIYGTETSYGANINTSSTGAQGAFQFEPGTAKTYGYPLTDHPNAGQFRAQAEAAARFIAAETRKYGSEAKAVEAYYAGHPGGQSDYLHKVEAAGGSHYGKRQEEELRGSEGGGSAPSIESLLKKEKEAHAKPKKAPGEGYVSPFSHATGVTRSRTDQGVDFSFSGGLGAVGKGRIVNIVQDPGGFGTEIVEELTEGAHKGQFVYYGLETGATSLTRKGASVKAGATLARGKGTGGIELGFASSAGGVPITPFAPGQSHEHATVGGEQFSKFLASIGKTGSSLSTATATFEKAAAHLILSSAQEHLVAGLTGAAAAAHAEVMGLSGYASGAGSAWERVRSLQVRRAKPLGTAAGNRDMTLIDTQDVETLKAQKVYYGRELAALGREVKAWGKLRTSYLKFARHATGHAKKEALDTAAKYEAKIKEAQKQATELHGTISDTEAGIEGAEGTLNTTLPGEIQSANLSNYQGALSKIAAEERAGILNPTEAQAAKTATANRALSGGYGALSEEGRLTVLGDLKEFTEALKEGTNALEAHTQALEASAKALHEFAAVAGAIGAVEAGSLARSLADTVSGQIAGVDFAGARLTAGVGTAARY